jgi:SAM-dependent methyltransferase
MADSARSPRRRPRTDGLRGRLRPLLDGGVRDELQRVAERQDALEAELAEHRAAVQRVMSEATDELREWLSNLQRDHEQISRTLDALPTRLAVPSALFGDGNGPLEVFDAGLGGSVVGFRGSAEGDAGDRVYLGFEDVFRGSEAAIRDRQRVYLPLLRDAGTVLDVGCGRGELLELLGEAGVEASGIDLDPGMVAHCRAKGLDRVTVADADSYLAALPTQSLGAVVALQVIEHLPYAALLAFLRTARRALRPGGRLIVETVNPHSPQALKHFWIDPTHQHPLFPEIIVALCSLVGFASAFIWHPQGSGDPDRDRGVEPDYAVVAQTVLSESAAASELVDDHNARS